jgi:hypothetical protein
LVVFFLSTAFFTWKNYAPTLHDPDYAFFQHLKKGIEKSWARNEHPELIIAHNALAEYLTFETRTDAMPWLPEYAIDSTRLWRVAAGVSPTAMRYFSTENIEKIMYLGGEYHFLPEYVWQKVLQKARHEQDTVLLKEAYSWRNPHQTRPAWLLKKKQ